MTGVDQVRQLEAARTAAILNSDFAAIEPMLDDELIYVHSIGLVEGKDSYLATAAEGGYLYHSIEVLSESSIQPTAETVVLNQTAQVSMTPEVVGHRVDVRLNVSTVWRLKDGDWRLVLLHSTAVTS